jgi:hypothetical protein
MQELKKSSICTPTGTTMSLATMDTTKKIWAVTYSDGYEFSGVIVEAYDDETAADLRALELNEKLKGYGGYSVEEYELNKRNEELP